MSISKEAIEAAARAIYDVRDDPYDDDEWEEMDSTDREECICQARAALTAAAPAIQAAALRDAADVMVRVHEMENIPDGQGSDEDEAAFADWDEASRDAWDDSDTAVRWLHARADQLEGKMK